MKQLLIIGGSDAGISAALRSKEIDPLIKSTVISSDNYPNFSICGLPFYLSGEVPDWRTLAHRTVEEIEKRGVRLLLEHRVVNIYPKDKAVMIEDITGRTHVQQYDKLVIASGAVAARPSLPGIDLPGVFTLRWIEDGFAIREYMEEHQPKSIVILGSGYIGLEMADALTRKGLHVTLLTRSGRMLKTIDPEMGEIIRKALSQHAVRIIDRIEITGITNKRGKFIVNNANAVHVEGDMLLVAAGGRPNTDLATGAGIATGLHGAIRVNRSMETNIKDIYAAGDCVATWHHLLDNYTYLPLGTTAQKQGRVAGENAAGGAAEFAGTLGTQVVKIFDLVVARTGLGQAEAMEAGFDPMTIELETRDHKVYYPGATPLRLRLTGDRKTHHLLGAQMIGHYGAEVSKRIDVFATALFNKMRVESLIDLDLSYTPPLSTPWDPVQMAAWDWIRELS